jgi:hypothetical protein
MSRFVYVRKLKEETNLVIFNLCVQSFKIQARSGAEIGEMQPKEN